MLPLSHMVTNKNNKFMYADVSRAYFYATAVIPVDVILPEKDREPGDETTCGGLIHSTYGIPDAAQHWSA